MAQPLCRVEEQRKLIVITGFGPFIGHEAVNASWEAVRLLPDALSSSRHSYVLKKIEVPVEYEAVDKVVEEIWALKPELVIHCGVHGTANCVFIEKLAYNHAFTKTDYAGKRLDNCSARLLNCKALSDNDVIRCQLDVKAILRNVVDACECTVKADNTSDKAVLTDRVQIAKISKDVGNYLCGYIYLKSLDMNRKRSLFIHVPPVDTPFSSQQTAEIVLKIIEECANQVEEEVSATC